MSNFPPIYFLIKSLLYFIIRLTDTNHNSSCRCLEKISFQISMKSDITSPVILTFFSFSLLVFAPLRNEFKLSWFSCNYTCDKQVLWQNASAFFRNFFTSIPKHKGLPFHFFRNYETPHFRLCDFFSKIFKCPQRIPLPFLVVGKNFRLLMRLSFFFVFFSRPFHENFKFLKNCPYDFHKILHSRSTPKGAPVCTKASKSYDWNVRNIAKINPKTALILFLIFLQTVQTIRTKISSHFLHHSMVLCLQFQYVRITGIGRVRRKRPKPTLLPHMRLWF